MNAASLLAEVEAAGLELEAAPTGQLMVGPKEKVTPEIRARLKANKTALLMLLQRQPCTVCRSRSWRLALDGVCYDCLTGLTQMRRNGAAL